MCRNLKFINRYYLPVAYQYQYQLYKLSHGLDMIMACFPVTWTNHGKTHDHLKLGEIFLSILYVE